MPQHVVVSEYDPAWPEQFELEAGLIRRALRDNLSLIHILKNVTHTLQQ